MLSYLAQPEIHAAKEPAACLHSIITTQGFRDMYAGCIRARESLRLLPHSLTPRPVHPVNQVLPRASVCFRVDLLALGQAKDICFAMAFARAFPHTSYAHVYLLSELVSMNFR